ncbi:IS3 family transposase [Mycoplasmopsis fermentans]|uniref:IS3 family transposase n=1 Tax=Mycoplasmopsis fermentans TaxID=2115 RepID=UPI000FF1AE54|nr:IS3 family transposase [Mycoplasmopsis fermentans]RMX34574.1 integrase core domain protein [Mycoplasmopsis fermentans MF-I2]
MNFRTREILGYSITKSPNLRMIGKMLENVEENGHSLNNVLIHSDQGWQYTHQDYIDYLKEKNAIQSMSRKGNCLDNSPTECLFSVIKREFWFGEEKKFNSFKEFKTALEEYISYYNNDRIVNKLKGLSPVQYRNKSKHN